MDWNPAPHQVPPATWASDRKPVWLTVADRGAGASRAAAEAVADWARGTPRTEILVVAPSSTLRSCFEGLSGLIARFENDEIKDYAPHYPRLTLANGSRMVGTRPGDIRGLSGDCAWASDLQLWTPESWWQLWFCLRNAGNLMIVANSTRQDMPEWVMDLVLVAHNPDSNVVVTSPGPVR